MTTHAPGLPWGRALTRDDLDTMPDDGHRYELIDGLLIVSPSPRFQHQRAVHRMAVLLEQSLTAGLEVLTAPFDVALADDTVIQPDVLVARTTDFTERDLPMAPVLAVEVLSPSTRGVDLLLKKDRLQRAGGQHYWVVDPGEQASVVAWRLVDGAYEEVGRATGEETLAVAEPFDCTIVPARLVD